MIVWEPAKPAVDWPEKRSTVSARHRTLRRIRSRPLWLITAVVAFPSASSVNVSVIGLPATENVVPETCVSARFLPPGGWPCSRPPSSVMVTLRPGSSWYSPVRASSDGASAAGAVAGFCDAGGDVRAESAAATACSPTRVN